MNHKNTLPLFLLYCLASCTNNSGFSKEPGSFKFVASMKIGWNLGNTLDAYHNGRAAETIWGNPPVTQELLNGISEAGFGAVRIPVTWLGHIGPAPDYQINGDRLKRVGEVVQYAHNAGLKVIINIHHDGSDSKYWLSVNKAVQNQAEALEVEQQFRAVWTQIAVYFKNYGENLVFEAMNEIHDGSWSDGDPARRSMVNHWNQVFVDAVRDSGGKNRERYLIIPGYRAAPNLTVRDLVIPNDRVKDRLIVSIHYYDPYTYAIQGQKHKWGQSVPEAERDTWGQEDHVRNTFGQIKAKFIDQGIPVIIGEYGAVRQEGYERWRKYYMEYVTKAAYNAGMIPFYWDNGAVGTGNENFGLFDRLTGKPWQNGQEIIEVMMKAVNQDYTLDTIVLP